MSRCVNAAYDLSTHRSVGASSLALPTLPHRHPPSSIMADIKDWMATATPDPEWNAAVDKLMGGQQPNLGLFPDIPSLRTWITNAKLATASLMGGDAISGIAEKDHQVEMRDGHKITCRVYSLEKAKEGGSPMFIAYHGGGWCIGGLENEEMLCRKVVSELGCVAVNVDYRLAPEWKFPVAVEDSWDATKWVGFSLLPTLTFIASDTDRRDRPPRTLRPWAPTPPKVS